MSENHRCRAGDEGTNLFERGRPQALVERGVIDRRNQIGEKLCVERHATTCTSQSFAITTSTIPHQADESRLRQARNLPTVTRLVTKSGGGSPPLSNPSAILHFGAWSEYA